jgi:insulysin
MKISKDFRVLKKPKKSTNDGKEYRQFELVNGLRVLLVKVESDGEEVKKKQNLAAVALCVGSGCFEDPKEVQGLSHFLEHMVRVWKVL